MATRFQSLRGSRRAAVHALGSLTAFGLSVSTTHSQRSVDNDDEELFHGQCLKRQLHRPRLPYPAWDYNWDNRMTEDSSLEGQQQRKRVTGTTRHIILVRHGQYDETFKDDALRRLTKLGRLQAKKTGQRLEHISRGHGLFENEDFNGPCDIKAIRVSNMARAKETASIIARQIPGAKVELPDPLLNEALPAPMIPVRPDIPEAIQEVDANHGRIEEAFQKYVYRGEAGPEDADEFEIIVCHGNVIRYFFCRALQLPPEAWLRMSLFNCSLTYLMVRPNGNVSARMLGDVGHLDYEETTFSGYHGFKW